MKRHRLLAAALTFMISAITSSAEGFIRVDEDERVARLQTAITRYEKDGATVDLIGAIHIADKAYYDGLNERFTGYEVVLFEMIGGDRIKEDLAPDPEAQRAKDAPLSALQAVYETVAEFLKLTGQTGAINYLAKNFVHADLSHAEFERMQSERGETIVGFAMEASREVPKNAKKPNVAKLLMAVMAGRPNLVKLELVHTLGHGDDQIGAFAGESVIITDRNRHCLDVMDKQFKAGRKNLGIFYGAAHFPDMEKRLLEQGFRQTKREWLTAWDIPKGDPAAAEKVPEDGKEAA